MKLGQMLPQASGSDVLSTFSPGTDNSMSINANHSNTITISLIGLKPLVVSGSSRQSNYHKQIENK